MSCFLDRILEKEHLVPTSEFGGSDGPVIEFSDVCEYSWHGVLKKNDWRTKFRVRREAWQGSAFPRRAFWRLGNWVVLSLVAGASHANRSAAPG